MSPARLPTWLPTRLQTEEGPGGRAFWVGVIAGGAIMAFGVRGLLTNLPTSQHLDFLKWFAGAAVTHDLVLAPVVCVIGFATTRAIPSPLRFPVQAGMITSAVVLAVSWAPLHGYGRDTVPDNLTVQPLNYATAVITVLALVWGMTAVWIIGASAKRRRP